ncbi:hypothetical protein WJX81_006587 [Elliptochloris bilobata]|uniref:Uncharacterized protein n=1 Tax=Elliptochloris bilobata TaxID=381761 RepID=A0AAW1RQR9_9CHLO
MGALRSLWQLKYGVHEPCKMPWREPYAMSIVAIAEVFMAELRVPRVEEVVLLETSGWARGACGGAVLPLNASDADLAHCHLRLTVVASVLSGHGACPDAADALALLHTYSPIKRKVVFPLEVPHEDLSVRTYGELFHVFDDKPATG